MGKGEKPDLDTTEATETTASSPESENKPTKTSEQIQAEKVAAAKRRVEEETSRNTDSTELAHIEAQFVGDKKTKDLIPETSESEMTSAEREALRPRDEVLQGLRKRTLDAAIHSPDRLKNPEKEMKILQAFKTAVYNKTNTPTIWPEGIDPNEQKNMNEWVRIMQEEEITTRIGIYDLNEFFSDMERELQSAINEKNNISTDKPEAKEDELKTNTDAEKKDTYKPDDTTTPPEKAASTSPKPPEKPKQSAFARLGEQLGKAWALISNYMGNALSQMDPKILEYIPGAKLFHNEIVCCRFMKPLQEAGVTFYNKDGAIMNEIQTEVILKPLRRASGMSVDTYMLKVRDAIKARTEKNVPYLELVEICNNIADAPVEAPPATPPPAAAPTSAPAAVPSAPATPPPATSAPSTPPTV